MTKQPTALNEQRYSDGSYLAENSDWHLEDSNWKAEKIASLMQNNDLHPRSVYEIGCGAGGILRCLAEKMHTTQFTGIEISEDALQICSQYNNSNVEYLLADVADLSLEKADVCLAIDVFEHVENHFEFLRKMKHMAEYKVFHIPLDMNVHNVIRGWPINKARDAIGHIHYFTKDTALATLKECGYEVIDFSYTAHEELIQHKSGIPLKSRLLSKLRQQLCKINRDFFVRLLGGHSLIVLAK